MKNNDNLHTSTRKNKIYIYNLNSNDQDSKLYKAQ